MKGKIYTIIALASVLSACSGFLEEAPKQNLTPDKVINTMEGIDMAAQGAYSPISSGSWYGGGFILANEMGTMNGRRWPGTSKDSNRETTSYMINWNPNSTVGLWGAAYVTINAANTVLENIDNVPDDPKYDKNSIKAEMYFLRALAYHDLVRTYAHPYVPAGGSPIAANEYRKADNSHLGVPVYTKPIGAQPSAYDYQPRATVGEVYERIVTDLLQAESYIGTKYEREVINGADPKGYVTKPVIQALLARVYLYMGKWNEAATYASKVINGRKYSLWTKKDIQYASCYTTAVASSEIIFTSVDLPTNSYGGGNENLCGMTSPVGTYGDCGASKDLYDLYENQDVRKTTLQELPEVNGYTTLKYNGKGINPGRDVNNTVIIRLAEMYLIRAEAAYHGAASGTSFVSDLKVIAERCGTEPVAETLDGIYIEREKEFAWEGQLWFDLARTGRAMTRTDVPNPSIPTLIPADDYRWARPISYAETQVNKNLVQNLGYNSK